MEMDLPKGVWTLAKQQYEDSPVDDGASGESDRTRKTG
jgi:hypothetical protein